MERVEGVVVERIGVEGWVWDGGLGIGGGVVGGRWMSGMEGVCG